MQLCALEKQRGGVVRASVCEKGEGGMVSHQGVNGVNKNVRM